jgi:hypothetical protein
MARILILSHSSDKHAFAVAEALKRKGAEPVVWCTSDYPTLADESIEIRDGKTRIAVAGPELSFAGERFSAVWHRRPLSVPDTAILHPADRGFALQQCEVFRRSLFLLLAPDAFWVNPPLASVLASQKIFQHDVAVRIGLEAPATLFSNSPDEVRRFISSQGGAAVFKPLVSTPWRDDETQWNPYTTLLRHEDLVDDDILRQTPSIYQANVPKAFELRITVMGRQAFAAKILSQETSTGKLDWRRSYDELKMESCEVPGHVLDACRRLMAELSIVFGCFDFIVTPDGRYVFLEVNEMGQFIFIEHYTDLPVLDAFCDFLIARDPAYERPRASAGTIRAADIEDAIKSAMAAAAMVHPVPKLTAFYEGDRERTEI